MAKPKYIVTSDTPAVLAGGFPERRGTELECTAWPRCSAGQVAPVNEPARKIWSYLNTHQFELGFPASPISEVTGSYFLPANLRDFRSSVITGIPAAPPIGAPKYRAMRELKALGDRVIKPGEEFYLLAWPAIDGSMVPANRPARVVSNYLMKNATNPALLSSPFCAYTNMLTLPTLPEPPAYRARDEQQAAWHDDPADRERRRRGQEFETAMLRKQAAL